MTASRPCIVEALEERRLMAFVISFTNAGFGVLPGQDLALPAPTLFADSGRSNLPQGKLGLPPSSIKLYRKIVIDLRGTYEGSVNLPQVGATPFTINVTKQKSGRITATISVLGRSITQNVPVNFATQRRIGFAVSQGSDFVQIAARLNRDNTVTGTVSGVVLGRPIAANLALTKVA